MLQKHWEQIRRKFVRKSLHFPINAAPIFPIKPASIFPIYRGAAVTAAESL